MGDEDEAHERGAGDRRRPDGAGRPILFISWLDVIDRGGQINLLRIVRGLDRRRFAPRATVPGRGPLYTRLISLGVPTRTLTFGHMTSVVDKFSSPHQWLGLLAAVRLPAPAVVYVDATHQVSTVRQACGPRTRVLWHVQTSTPTAHDEEALRAADVVVSVSPSVDARLAAVGTVRPRRLVSIPNAVDADAFCPGPPDDLRTEAGLGPDDRLILFVGAILQVKGVEDLLRAFAALDRADSWLWMVGSGEQGPHEDHRRLARELGVDARVRWWGARPDVARFMRACDVFAFPSHAEGLPLVLLEAMASGCACVAADVPGVRHLLEGGAGALVPARRPDALAAAIGEMLDAPEKRLRCGALARRRVLDRYTLPMFERAFDALLTDISG